jgi:hypothetical protein
MLLSRYVSAKTSKHSPPSPFPDFEHSFSSLADCSSKEKHICFDSFQSTNKYDIHLCKTIEPDANLLATIVFFVKFY